MTRPPRDASSTGELAGLGEMPRNVWLIGIGCAVLLAAIVYAAPGIARPRRSSPADEGGPPPVRAADRVAAPPGSARRPR
jgi:hypothetical protein